MPLVTWSDDFCIQITEIDNQHKWLVDMLNRFYDAVLANESKKSLRILLEDLTDYTVTHFAAEEKKFDVFKYEHTVEHKKSHKKFIDKVTDVKQRVEDGREVLPIEMVIFLKDWLLKHIQDEDRQFFQCFHTQSTGLG
ncbi:MAG: bacteriohemerythrin [Fibrobacterales bacterium]